MVQKLQIALAQAKAGNTHEHIYLMKSVKLYIPCIEQNKLLKMLSKI